MMRVWPPMTTWPLTGGALGSVGGALDLSVATRSRRMPPWAGAGNASDSRRSPSTTATAFRVSPGGRLPNSALPAWSVFAVRTSDPTWSSTGKSWMLFDIAPRMRRTDTVPFGRSVTGRGMPDICLGSGIANWARSGAPTKNHARSTTNALHHGGRGGHGCSMSNRPGNKIFVPPCPLCPRCKNRGAASELVPAVLAEARVWIVHRRTGRPAGRHRGMRRGLTEPLRQIALDLLSIPTAGVELAHQARRTGAQPP